MMKIRKGEQPLVMMMKEVMLRVIVVTAEAVTMDMMMMTVTPTVKAIIVKTMIVNTVAMIGVNPLMIENIKIMGSIMKSMMMM